MANAFLKNFRESTDRIATPNMFGVTDFSRNSNLPNYDFEKNSEDWRARVAVPFSYESSDGRGRQYGVIYAPKSQAVKFFNDYNEDGSPVEDKNDIAIYGAELSDGTSLTSKGLINLVNNTKNRGFRLEKDLVGDIASNAKQSPRNAGVVQVVNNPDGPVVGNRNQDNGYSYSTSPLMQRLLDIVRKNNRGGL